MKKTIFISFFAFICANSVAQEYICLKDGSVSKDKPTMLSERTVENTEEGILATYKFHYAKRCTDTFFPSASVIYLDGFGIPEGDGTPALPRKLDRFAIPIDEPYKIIITDSSYIEMPMEIAPARPAMVSSSKVVCSQENVTPVKPYTGFFPSHVLSSTLSEYRTNGILDIEVSPVQYDYLSGKVRIYTSLSYLVEFDHKKMENTEYMKTGPNADPFLRNIVMNPKEYSSETKENTRISGTYEQTTPPNYLIITVPSYLNAVNKLIDWKRTQGFNVQLCCQNTWTESAVISAINNYNNINYLLIVGEFGDVPGKMMSNHISLIDKDTTYTFYSDYYYGCYHLFNLNIPIMRRGRLSVSTSAEAMTVVDKIIKYEREPITDESFYNTGLNCCVFEDHNNDGVEDYYTAKTTEKIRDYLVNVVGKGVNRVYKAYSKNHFTINLNPMYWSDLTPIPSYLLKSNGFQWDGYGYTISNFINNGVFYVLHESHGNNDHWGNPYYEINNIHSLSNGNKTPIVFSMNCCTGKFQYSECFAEAFLRKANGGCVAIIAPSEETFDGYDESLAIGMFNAIWPSNGYFQTVPSGANNVTMNTQSYRIGDILDIGLEKISTIYENSANNPLKHIKEAYHCFGDPAMEIYTATPTPFENVSITKSNNTLYLTLQDNANITFYNTSTGVVETFYGTALSYPYSTDLRICISAHNKIPLIIDEGVLYLQNEEIASSINYEADEIQVGSNVTDVKSSGDVIINGGNIVLKGHSIELHDNTIISADAQVEIDN